MIYHKDSLQRDYKVSLKMPLDCPSDCQVCIPLSHAKCRHCLRIVSVLGGQALRRRLAELGFIPGSEVEVIHRHGGQLIVSVRQDARMALRGDLARNLLCEELA